jgi:catechol 2,3-dioxygenase-like lactoylglutathione lyase family enzyme
MPGPSGSSHQCRLVLNSRTVPTAIHHAVVIVRDLDASLRFYRDGLGLELLQDRQVNVLDGDVPDGLTVLLTPGSITRGA